MKHNQSIQNVNRNAKTFPRKCFICDSELGNIYLSGNWPITKIGTVDVNYRVCDNCALVRMDPLIDQASLNDYYQTMSSYSSIYESKEIAPVRKKMVDGAIEYLNKQGITNQGSALEIGSADGYLLNRLQQMGWKVRGIEPSNSRAAHARETYNIFIVNLPFEDYANESGEKHELVLLCQILEHIHDPLPFLAKIRELMHGGSHFYLEVPLLCDPDFVKLPGSFQFEHIQYFTEHSLDNLMGKAGFELIGEIECDYGDSAYLPIMRAIYRKSELRFPQYDPVEVDKIEAIMERFVLKEKVFFNKFVEHIHKEIPLGSPIVIWGGGVHTSILLYNTNLQNEYKIRAIIDSDPAKQGEYQGNYEIISAERYLTDYKDIKLLISTFGGEAHIANFLNEKGYTPSQYVRLYEAIGYDTAQWFI